MFIGTLGLEDFRTERLEDKRSKRQEILKTLGFEDFRT
jgi:hypothetical protein